MEKFKAILRGLQEVYVEYLYLRAILGFIIVPISLLILVVFSMRFS